MFALKAPSSISLPLPLNQHYFGLDAERYIVYNVIEINHDENAVIKHDTLYYQLKTLIGDTVVDNEGRIARKFYRSKRPDIFSPWVITDLWTAIIANNKAELVEENHVWSRWYSQYHRQNYGISINLIPLSKRMPIMILCLAEKL